MDHLVRSFVLDVETWCLRKNEESGTEDDGPGKLDCDRDSVASRILAILCRIVYNGCQEET